MEKQSVKLRIIKISNELRLKKQGRNEWAKYDYFKPDDIMRAITPLLEKYNLIAIFNMEFIGETYNYKGTLKLEDCNSDDHVLYRFDIPLTEVKGAGSGQNAGATQTYCKRYMFMNTFNIADNKDDLDNKTPKKEIKQDMIEKIKKAFSKEEDIMNLQDAKEKMEKSKKYSIKEKKEILEVIIKRIDELSKT